MIRSGAIDVDGPMAPYLLHMQHVVFPLAIIAVLAFCGWIGRKVGPFARLEPRHLCAMLSLLLTVAVLLSNVFSTQYILWLLPFSVGRSRLRLGLMAAICVTTLCVFPFWVEAYAHMTRFKVLLLDVRMLLLAALAVDTARSLWRDANAQSLIEHPSDANSASASASSS